MTTALKPSAGVTELLFEAATAFYISNIFICAVADDTFSVGIQPDGSPSTSTVYSNTHLKENETFVVTALSLSPGDKIYVTSLNGDTHFTLTGDGM